VGSRLIAASLGLLVLAAAARGQDAGLGRHKQLYAVPAPGKVAIDGKVDDWDLSGQIEMYVSSDGKDRQSAKFALMYDAEALYLSGVVRDPSPMMNRQDPKVSGDRGWNADSVQFRLELDPAQAYPIKEYTWKYKKDGSVADVRDDIKHLTLWYYTDREEPCLAMQMGMAYRTPRPEWKPFGVIPADQYESRYRKTEDGKGYVFEYRIPWSTLGAKAPLKGGDVVAGTVQFNWGTPDGLTTGGFGAWAYDLLAGSGIAYQNAEIWGKVIFSKEGKVPEKLVKAGVPAEKPAPLDFSYELPRDGQITLQVVDRDRMVRRILLAQADRAKGKHTEHWDGMDDQGKPLLPGDYTLQGIIHDPITSRFLFSVHNSGQPPYPTDDGKGGWGADHGLPTGCSALPDGMLLTWDVAEYGWAIIRVDLDGHKQWGVMAGASFIANDGRRLFIYDAGGFHPATGIQVLDLDSGRPLNFGNGKPLLEAPAGGTKETNAVTGLAYANGQIYASYGRRNLVGVFDAKSGDPVASWEITRPGLLAARPDGTIVGFADGVLSSFAAGKATALPGAKAGDLDVPSGLAAGADGLIYVSNQGQLQDIAVLDATGKLVRRIGRSGGRPAVGEYDNSGVFQPQGIALDSRNRLWVAEHADGPKRISVWNAATGVFEKEYFGGSSYAAYAFINPDLPAEVICHNMLWQIDWDACTTTPVSTIWRKTSPDMIPEASPDGYFGLFRSLTATNGQQYSIAGYYPSMYILSRRVGNKFQPFLATLSVNREKKKGGLLGLPVIDDHPDVFPNGGYLWQDANDDGCVQAEEVKPLPANFPLRLKALSPDMTVWMMGGTLMKPSQWRKNGQPVYDPATMEKNFLAGTPAGNGYLWLDPKDGVYTNTPGQRPSIARWASDGKMLWGYPSLVDWPKALGMPVSKAGRIFGPTGGLGVAGEYTGVMSYFGVSHLFRCEDGIYTAAIMKDGRSAKERGAEEGPPEGQGGVLVRVVPKPGAPARTLLLAGGQDARVTEVLGLDSVKTLPEQTFKLTEEQVKHAADVLAQFQQELGTGPRLVLYPGKESLKSTAPVVKSFDGNREFSAHAAYDAENLYVSFDVSAPSDLINAITDQNLVFKGGNCLDLQVAADPAADPKRKTPAPGDARLLVTRRLGADGKPAPYAVLFQPKLKEFSGQPIVLNSPTGKESFDAITVTDAVKLDYQKTMGGFTALVTVPLKLLGLAPKPGTPIRMDLGYLYGNATGSHATARSYLKNTSFSANVLNDVPNESRLEPAEWADVTVE